MSLLTRFKNKYIGDRKFYRTVLLIIIPVIIQNSISNFVNLLDNLMVGALGDAQMSGVSIANQLIFIFNLSIFGGLAGPGIFGAQFYGAKDIPNLRNTFRIKLWESIILLAVMVGIILGFSEPIISLFLKGEGTAEMAAMMLQNGQYYLKVSLFGLPAFALAQCYSGTLRETGETRLPMVASVAAVITNAVFNYLLIFGAFGFPRLEVVGAALATVISRYVELGIVVVFTHRHHQQYSFIDGAFETLKVPGSLLKNVAIMSAPLLLNEILWSTGVSTQRAIFSLCGLSVVSAMSISSTISNLFNSVYMSMGTAVSVMIGQALGAGDFERAKDEIWKLVFFSIAAAGLMGVLLWIAAPIIPLAYTGISKEIKDIASELLRITSVMMPIYSFTHVAYFTLRSGGKSFITFLFDSGFTWVIAVPLSLLMVKITNGNILTSFLTVEGSNMIKVIIGYLFIRSGTWIQNLTNV